MKFWNKDKSVRQRCWTKVTLPHNTTLKQVPGGRVQKVFVPADEVKRWCQQQNSTGKFYYYYGSNSWWFESADDALVFKLKWQ